MDPRAALSLHVEWGADEALEPRPCDRMAVAALPARLVAAAAPPPSPAPRQQPPTRLVPTSLQALAEALAGCDGAGLAVTASHLVLPVGAPGGLLVVAEAPGAEEDRSGQAFTGPDGVLLRRMLASIQLDPDEVLLGYLAPWRPPGGRPLNDTEIAGCAPFLRQLIELARPTLVLALGSVTAKTLLGMAARRGRWGEMEVADRRLPILPTASPAVLLRQPRQKAAAWADLRMVRRRIDQLTAS